MTTASRPRSGPPGEYHFPRFERHTLANGLTVIVAPVRKLPVVSVALVLDVTAVDDPPGHEGLAELSAQALREGTTTRDGAQLAIDLETLGTSFEAGADWDSTVASMTVLCSRLDRAFPLLAEILQSPSFRQEDVERLKAERIAERMQILAEPRGLADESFSRILYSDGARYSEPMSGTTKSVSSIDREKVAGFYNANYRADATTVILSGDIDVEPAVALVERHLGSWQAGQRQVVRQVSEEARALRTVEVVARPDAAQSEIRIGHVGVERRHPRYFDLVVMNAIFGGLFSSRVNLNLREVHGYTYSASSYFDWRRQAGPFAISTAVQSEVTADAIRETLGEIDRMREEAVTKEELTLATSYLAGVFPIRYETTAAIVSALAGAVTFGLPEDYFDTYRANIAGVTEDDVLSAAKSFVDPDRLRIVVVGNPDLVAKPLEDLAIGPVSIRQPVDG